MNAAQQKVLAALGNSSLKTPITTSNLANELGLSRSVVSHYLNELMKKEYVKKIEGRPVKWILQKNVTTNLAFQDFIGAKGSLSKIINQVSSAVVYPPHGLNILITGHSGVGKSYLASKICAFAREKGVIAPSAPYIVLNCADYANNPELVSSMLFGYVKGAYTGADETKSGLLEQANGGYLFLDEVHRLSNENQEKIFSFLDSGQFYKMGDNTHPIRSNVRLILATTEDPQEVLLTTFLRRIPVSIALPDYAARPLNERLTLLKQIFMQEAKSINKKIQIDKYVLSALLKLKSPGNIGFLKNVIKVSCASAYHRQSDQNKINLQLDDLMLDKISNFEDFGSLIIDPHELITDLNTDQIRPRLDKLIAMCKQLQNENNEENLKKVKLSVLSLNKYLSYFNNQSGLHQLHQNLYTRIIEKQYGLNKTAYLEKIIFYLYALHFKLPEDILNDLSEMCYQNLPRSFHVANVFYQKLNEIDQQTHFSLAIILSILLSDHVDENIKLRGLIVAHGQGTATSIQSVVNSLCQTYVFDALDMPIEAGVNSIIRESNRLIDSFNTTNGFILMFDMGSLSQLYSAIKNHLDGDLLVVNNVTTLTALDLALKMQSNVSFKTIAEKAEQDYKIDVQYYEGVSQLPNILISCISGMGISEKVKEIIQPILPAKIKVIPLDYSALSEKIRGKEWQFFDKTLFVLTTMDLSDEVKFKYLNLYNLLDKSGEDRLRRWLSPYMTQKQINQFFHQVLHFFSKEGISERLSFLNPDVVIKEVEMINNKYENFYHLKLDGKVRLNLYMHIALMIERLMVQKNVSVEVEPQTEAEQEFFAITHSIFQPIEIKYNIHLSNYEISLLYELFRQFI